MYTLVLEDLLGFHLHNRQLHLTPRVPHSWDTFSLTLHVGASTWHFHFSRTEPLLTLDGVEVPDGITLFDDGRIHQVRAPLA